jgi:hypothetical protein
LFQVLVESPTGDQVFRLGTAWRVGERHLATSGSVVQAAEVLRPRFPILKVRPAVAGGADLPVLSAQAHPQYRTAVRNVDHWRQRADALRSQLADDGQPLSGEQLERLVEEAVAAEERWFLALEERTSFDAGLLEVRLPPADRAHPPPRLAPAGRPQVGDVLELVGLPFPTDDVLVFAPGPPAVRRTAGHIVGFPQLPDRSPPVSRLLVRVSLPEETASWTGSPLCDGQGNVVAVYSRPAPPLKPGDPPPADRFDAASVQRLHELLAEFPAERP